MVFNKNVLWSPSAKKDIENITDYLIKEWGTRIVSNFLSKLNWIISQIVINPKQYPKINSKLKIRKCVITKQNTLFYRIKGTKVEIIRIYDTRQNPKKLRILF